MISNPMLHNLVDRFSDNFDKAYELLSDLASDAELIHEEMHSRSSRTLEANFNKIVEGMEALEDRLSDVRKKVLSDYTKLFSYSWKIQSVLVPRDEYSLKEAKVWIKDHGFKIGKFEATDNYYRFKQFESKQCRKKQFRTIALSSRVKAIVCEKK